MLTTKENDSETIQGLEIDPINCIQYGLLFTFVRDKKSVPEVNSDTYKASKAAVNNVVINGNIPGKCDTLTVNIEGELIAVTAQEAKLLGLEQYTGEWHSYSTMNSVGRPAVLKAGKRVNVYLDETSLTKASELGGGNVSVGIRKALASVDLG